MAIHIGGGIVLPGRFESITCIGSSGQLHFDSSIREFKNRAFRTIVSDFPSATKIRGLMNVFSLFSRISISLFTLSCKGIGTLLAC